jgi:hypothetical protein
METRITRLVDGHDERFEQILSSKQGDRFVGKLWSQVEFRTLRLHASRGWVRDHDACLDGVGRCPGRNVHTACPLGSRGWFEVGFLDPEASRKALWEQTSVSAAVHDSRDPTSPRRTLAG